MVNLKLSIVSLTILNTLFQKNLSDSFIGFHVQSDIKKKLEEVCEARGEQLSSFARRAILRELAQLSYLSEAQKKALAK